MTADAEGGQHLERVIPDPGFAGDDGTEDLHLAAALAAYRADPGEYLAALAVLQDTRVLVPVIAVLGEVEYDENGLAHDKTSDMATVLITGRDGRKALLAFTSMTALQTWNPESRPVPVVVSQAAASAIQDGADALLVDVAGPVMFAIEGEDLRSLAAGHQLRQLDDGWAWTRPI